MECQLSSQRLGHYPILDQTASDCRRTRLQEAEVIKNHLSSECSLYNITASHSLFQPPNLRNFHDNANLYIRDSLEL